MTAFRSILVPVDGKVAVKELSLAACLPDAIMLPWQLLYSISLFTCVLMIHGQQLV